MSPFERLKKGATPTFLNTFFANRVIDLLNAVFRMRIAPAAAGKIVVGEDAIVIDLTPMQAAQQAAAIEAIQKTQAAQQAQINALISALKGATISATCNPDPFNPTITVTITFPNLP